MLRFANTAATDIAKRLAVGALIVDAVLLTTNFVCTATRSVW